MRRQARLAAVTLVAIGGLLPAIRARADRLAWISASDAAAAAARVAPDSLLVAYCSECNERVEVWRVRKAEVAPTTAKTYFQLRVTARRLFRSRSVIARGEYREPIAYEPAVAKRPDGSDLETTADVDLAYVYVPEGGRFRVLGKVLGLPCDVAVETITLPAEVLESLGSASTPAAGGAAGKDAMDVALELMHFEVIAGHEVSAIGDVRSFVSEAAARGAHPPSAASPPVVKLGYRRQVHAGPAGSPARAYTATPDKPGESGIHGFCGDDTGRICYTTEGSTPAVTAGRCAPSCRDLPAEGLLDEARPRLSDDEKATFLAALDKDPRMSLQSEAIKDAMRAAIQSAASPAGAKSAGGGDRAHAGAAGALAFTPDGKALVSSSPDEGKLKVWSVPDGSLLRTIDLGAPGVWTLLVTADGRTVVASCMDRTVRLFSLPDGTPRTKLTGFDSVMTNLAATADGRTLATGSSGIVALWSLPDGRRLSTPQKAEALGTTVALSGDGRTLAAAPMLAPLRVWSLPEVRLVAELTPPSGNLDFTQLALSADGTTAAAAQGDGSVLVWSLPRGRLVSTARGHAFPINRIALSADGRTLVSASSDMTAKVWRLPEAALQASFRGHKDEAYGAALSPDGKLAASSDKTGAVFLWDTATAAPRAALSDPAVARP